MFSYLKNKLKIKNLIADYFPQVQSEEPHFPSHEPLHPQGHEEFAFVDAFWHPQEPVPEVAAHPDEPQLLFAVHFPPQLEESRAFPVAGCKLKTPAAIIPARSRAAAITTINLFIFYLHLV